MTSYRKMNKQLEITGYYRIRETYISTSKILDTGKKFPHVKYVNQLIKDNRK